MHDEPTTAHKLRRLPWSLVANGLNAVYSQLTFFGSVFVLFLSQLGLSKSTIGTLLSLIPFFGLVALFVTPAVARRGYKWVYITCFTIRKFVTLALLATPAILLRYGPQAMLWTVVVILSLFSLLRALAITASHPWEQEYIPDVVRGKFAAVNQVVIGLAGFAAITAAGAFLGSEPALRDFGRLFVLGTAFGLASMIAWTYVPGGAPETRARAQTASPRGLLQAARDPNLAYFLAGLGLVTLASAGLGSFVTLYQRESLGLTPDQVLRLAAAGLAGALLTSFLWGWAADRYGSRPVMLLGVYLKALLPVLWFVLPRGSVWTLPLALGVSAWQGLANMGWTVGSTRLLFTDVVPPPKRAGYMAVHYAWLSTVEGLSQVLSGRLLDLTASLHGQWLGVTLDPYSLLFAAGTVLPLLGSLPLRRVHVAGAVSVRRLASMLLRGKPWLAVQSLIGYRLARTEPAAVTVTERLGQAHSPLTVEELVASLADPRFNVRFEAVVSMAHHGADPALTQALADTLSGPDPALSTLAAWALGRSGDRSALPALRQGLGSRYRSVQAHCARALATLGDADSAPGLLERMLAETDDGVQTALAAALGMLRHEPAAATIQDLLWRQTERGAQLELALALARLVGEERTFVQLARPAATAGHGASGTALSQTAATLARKLRGRTPGREATAGLVLCAEALARDDLDGGAALLGQAVRALPAGLPEPAGGLLQGCVNGLEAFGSRRPEYLWLALHALSALTEQG